MTLPAWDSIVGDDRWRGLTDQHRKTVFQKYLGDIGQLKEWQTLNDDQKEELLHLFMHSIKKRSRFAQTTKAQTAESRRAAPRRTRPDRASR